MGGLHAPQFNTEEKKGQRRFICVVSVDVVNLQPVTEPPLPAE